MTASSRTIWSPTSPRRGFLPSSGRSSIRFLENRADIQQEMIGTLEQHKPPYVVLDSEFTTLREPNGSAISTGVYLLDNYIATHYEEVHRYGELTILRRRE